MGAAASRGRKQYKPNKAGASVEHAKFASGDSQVTSKLHHVLCI